MVLTRARRIILILILIFAVYSVVTNPTQSAAAVKVVFVWLAAAVQSLFTFLNALLPRK